MVQTNKPRSPRTIHIAREICNCQIGKYILEVEPTTKSTYLIPNMRSTIETAARRVETEDHSAGDSPVNSGRSFGRGSSGRNSEYPVVTGPLL